MITRALGVEPVVDIELTSDKMTLGDVYLLCSDGLHGFVSDERIEQIIEQQAVLTRACAALIQEANANGGGDNITAVLIRIDESDEPWRVATSIPPPPSSSSDADETIKTVAVRDSDQDETRPLPPVQANDELPPADEPNEIDEEVTADTDAPNSE